MRKNKFNIAKLGESEVIKFDVNNLHKNFIPYPYYIIWLWNKTKRISIDQIENLEIISEHILVTAAIPYNLNCNATFNEADYDNICSSYGRTKKSIVHNVKHIHRKPSGSKGYLNWLNQRGILSLANFPCFLSVH